MKRLALPVLLLLLLICAAQACGADALTLAAATDLHVNPAYQMVGLINPLEPVHLQIVDAFLWDAQRNGVDVVLLLGDITNQGRVAQHELLIEKLRAAQAAGLRVLVLPGNHDIGEVGTSEFAQLYAEFGYGDAYSRDDVSLSYTMRVGDRLLMLLDTHGYEGQRDSASISRGTLVWMGQQLAVAKENGWQVIAAGHYPMITEHSTPFTGREEALRLFQAYGVELYLSGHLHKRCVTAKDGLTELVVDQTIAYPCCYARLTFSDDGAIAYQPSAIAVSQWAAENGVQDANLRAFDAYQTALEKERSASVVERIRRDREVAPEDLQQAKDFFWLMTDCRAHGTLSRYADALRHHPGYELMVDLSVETIYERWIPKTINTAVPYTTGFELRDGVLTEGSREE